MEKQSSALYMIPASVIIAGGLIAAAIIFSNGSGGGALTAGANAGSNSANQFANANSAVALNIRPVDENDHVRGSRDAIVSVVEFSDFECPFCNRIHPTLTRIVEDFDGDVNWVYRHFPLTSIHSNAGTAAAAAECAASLGGNDAFWQFADALFENQRSLGSRLYTQLATNIGLAPGAFEQCMNDTTTRDAIALDLRDATDSGGRGTPYVVVLNGDGEPFPFSGALPYEQVRAVVEQALRSS